VCLNALQALQVDRDMKLVLLVGAALAVLLPRGVDAADSLQVRQVAKCAPYITKNSAGYVLLVRVPTDLVGAGGCGLDHSCCYVPCKTSGKAQLPLPLLEHALHAGAPLGVAGTPGGCAPQSIWVWAGGMAKQIISAPQLASELATRVIPRAMQPRHAWVGSVVPARFVPIELADRPPLLRDTWPLLTQSGALSLVAGRRNQGPSVHDAGVLHVLLRDADKPDARRVEVAADKRRDGGWHVTVSQQTRRRGRGIGAELAEERPMDFWVSYDPQSCRRCSRRIWVGLHRTLAPSRTIK